MPQAGDLAGRALLSCQYWDHSLRLHDLDGQGSDPCPEKALHMEHGSTVLCVAISTDGRTVITGSSDCTARIWHLGHPMDDDVYHHGHPGHHGHRGHHHGDGGAGNVVAGTDGILSGADGGGRALRVDSFGALGIVSGDHLPAGGHDKQGLVRPMHVLCAHAEAVVTVALSCELNVAVTGR